MNKHRIMQSLSDRIPLLQWLPGYKRSYLNGDIVAGIVVTVVLIPQAIAYAMLAGLPPETGLYAGMAALPVYAILGSSRTLSVGPVAIDSILIATIIAPLAAGNPEEYLVLAVTLAFLVGVWQIVLSLLRLGDLVNFISRPVINGFTNAAALIIALSQLKYILGIEVTRSTYAHQMFISIVNQLYHIHWPTVTLTIAGVTLLLVYTRIAIPFLSGSGLSDVATIAAERAAPLVLLLVLTALSAVMHFSQSFSIAIVGNVPAGLPKLALPQASSSYLQSLLMPSFVLALISFLESISIGKTLAARKRQKVDPNQELLSIGAANIASSIAGGFTVSGGFGRSAVNDTAGARTGLASIITAGLIALTVLFLTPLFYYLPKAVLAIIIISAVLRLIDFPETARIWRFNKTDGISGVFTFFAVLAAGIQFGILLGILLTIGLYLWRTSRPHLAEVGRVKVTEHYRNVKRHEVKTCPHVLAVRFDESLYFANVNYLENKLANLLAERPDTRYVLLVCTAVNRMDASALKALQRMDANFKHAGITLLFSEVKGPVMDHLERAGFVDAFGKERFYFTTHQAMQALNCIE